MPASLDYQNLIGLVSQRESCMVSLKYLVPPKPARISPPAHHKDMISRIYTGLGRSVIFQSPSKFSGPGEVIDHKGMILVELSN
jgi:hypothetical protein